MKDDKKTKASAKTKRRPFHEEFAEKIIDHLKAGTAPWQRPWHPGKTLAAPHNPASGTVYRGMNRVHLSLSGYEDPRWMTLRQANDNGLRILPGSKATPVVYFQFNKEQDRIGEDGKPILGEDGKPQKQTVELDKPIVRFAHVFNAEQIDGIPPIELTDKSFEWEPVEKAENILAAVFRKHEELSVEHEGKKFSVGLVRFARIKALQKIAREILSSGMPEDTVLLDMTLNKTDATRIRHELANANHAILLGASLLSRYWEDLVSHMDMLDDAHEEQSSCDEDCREARKNGSTVIENIIKSARRIEVHLAKLREDALDSVGKSA